MSHKQIWVEVEEVESWLEVYRKIVKQKRSKKLARRKADLAILEKRSLVKGRE